MGTNCSVDVHFADQNGPEPSRRRHPVFCKEPIEASQGVLAAVLEIGGGLVGAEERPAEIKGALRGVERASRRLETAMRAHDAIDSG